MTALPPTPAKDATITERLQSWTQYWPPVASEKTHIVEVCCLLSASIADRPCHCTDPSRTQAPFTYADIPALIEAINDQSVCRWIDAYRPVRLVITRCVPSPASVMVTRDYSFSAIQMNHGTRARQATAQALAVWWRSGPSELTPEELPVFIRQQMLVKYPLVTL